MRYKYTYRTTARDLWQLSMYYIYGSLAGLCNIIFTVAAFALGFSRWDQAQGIVRCLIVLGAAFFTVIQPLMIYAKAKEAGGGDYPRTPRFLLTTTGFTSGWAMTRRSCRGSR